jgi:L-asparaginase
MPRVVAVFTGGTISMTADATAGGNIPTLSGAAILEHTPGLDAIATVTVVDLGRTPASHFRFGQLFEIAAAIERSAGEPGVDGVVLVQGTDTLDETAFFFDLVLSTEKPVVVTGAMRSASEPGYDGPANLRDAVACAASPALCEQGVVVVLGGTIHAADDVAKTHASSLTTFRSPDFGPLGVVERGHVSVARHRAARRQVRTSHAADRVQIVTATVAMDGSMVDALHASGLDGLVVEATGAGNTDPGLLEACRRLVEAGIPVVLVSRTGAGRVDTGYAFPGGGATWAASGVILAGHLTGPKARVALALGLGAGLDRAGLVQLLADPWDVAPASGVAGPLTGESRP